MKNDYMVDIKNEADIEELSIYWKYQEKNHMNYIAN